MNIFEYHKIPGPFSRNSSGPDKNKIIPWSWTSPELEFLKDVPWNFTEKIDGTNIRVIWDGHKPEFRGRTDAAQIPAKLLEHLKDTFPEELFEQTFENREVVLFGEGYGSNIQKGGNLYRKEASFILFDVYVAGWWLTRDGIIDVANAFDLEVVPLVFQATLTEAIKDMSTHLLPSEVAQSDRLAEGVVGTPAVPLFARSGKRIIVKLKSNDLFGLTL